MAANKEWLAGKSVLFVFNSGYSTDQLQRTISSIRDATGEGGSVALEHAERLGLGYLSGVRSVYPYLQGHVLS